MTDGWWPSNSWKNFICYAGADGLMVGQCYATKKLRGFWCFLSHLLVNSRLLLLLKLRSSYSNYEVDFRRKRGREEKAKKRCQHLIYLFCRNPWLLLVCNPFQCPPSSDKNDSFLAFVLLYFLSRKKLFSSKNRKVEQEKSLLLRLPAIKIKGEANK